MKKLFSAFLAVSMLCVSCNAFAAGSISSVSGSRNGKDAVVSNYSSKTSMPGFRTGDTITFNLSGLTTDEVVTLISAACDSSGAIADVSDDSVQYINQYDVSASSKTIEYRVRNLDAGIYALLMNDGSGTIAKFYYKVGDIDVKMVPADGTPYRVYAFDTNRNPVDPVVTPDKVATYSIGFIAQASVDSADVAFSDLGATPGFTITKGGNSYSEGFSGASLDALEIFVANHEVAGSFTAVYGVTVYNIPDGQQTGWSATAVADTPAN